MDIIIGIIAGYIFGSFNMAYLIARIKNIDIKNVGTKNPGASNVFISVGKTYGILVGLFDILKSFFSGTIVFYITEQNLEASVLACCFAVLGHILPVFSKFSGGKGFAPFMGAVLFYDWKLFLAFAGIIVIIVAITKYIAIATFTLTMLLPVYVLIFDGNKIISSMFLCLMILIWFKHRDNMVRLLNGKEVNFFGKVKK